MSLRCKSVDALVQIILCKLNLILGIFLHSHCIRGILVSVFRYILPQDV